MDSGIEVFVEGMNLVLGLPLLSFNIPCTGIEGRDRGSNHESLCYCTHTISEENSQDAFALIPGNGEPHNVGRVSCWLHSQKVMAVQRGQGLGELVSLETLWSKSYF